MNIRLLKVLLSWPKPYISFDDIAFELKGTHASRYGIINRAIKEGFIQKIKRGLYHITLLGKRDLINNYELAQVMYGPSFITSESALQYHNAIPEAVYTVISGTSKKSAEFHTSIGAYAYYKLPKDYFYLGVERVEVSNGTYFMANPWKAIADLIYLHKKEWKCLDDAIEDMRLDLDFFQYRDELWELVDKYPNQRTRSILKSFKKII